jgi:hypothetical protein
MVIWIAVAGLVLLAHGLLVSFLNDDAFISYRYARNFANGQGLVFNPGERVEGYTNFLWTVMLGIGMRLGADPLPLSKIMGFLASLGTLIVTARLSWRLAPSGSPGRGIALLLLAASTPFAYWTFAGLEGPLFALLLILVTSFEIEADRADPSRQQRLALFSGGALALLAMTRPEGVPLFGLFLLLRVARTVSTAEFSWRNREGFFVLAFAAVYVPYFAWRFQYYGFLFPNTYYVRQGESLAQNLDLYRSGVQYLLGTLREGGGCLLLAPVLLLAAPRGRFPGLGRLAAVVTAWTFYLVLVGGDSKVLFRFYAPILPLVFVLTERSVAALLTTLRDHHGLTRSRAALRRATLAFAAVAVAIVMTPSFFPPEKYEVDRTFFAMLAEGGKWLHENASPGASVACFAVGALPYYAQLVTYDVLGVTDAHIAHGPLTAGQMTGHGKTDLDYILSKNPTYFLPMGNLDLRPFGYQYASIPVTVDGEPLQLRVWKRAR